MVALSEMSANLGQRNFLEQIKAPIFLGGCFRIRDNVRAFVQFRKER